MTIKVDNMRRVCFSLMLSFIRVPRTFGFTTRRSGIIYGTAGSCSCSGHRRFTAPSSPILQLSQQDRHQDNTNLFLNQVEDSVAAVLEKYSHLKEKDDILSLPGQEREALGIARHVSERLQALRRNDDCPWCWLQRAHCICEECQPVSLKELPIRRIFLVMHHKEVGLKLDTAKLILAAFPDHGRLVVSGIGPEYQPSMKEMMDVLKEEPHRCLILFPDETARPYDEILKEASPDINGTANFDLIVLDGTWAQARKMYQRYFATRTSMQRVQLGSDTLQGLEIMDDTTKGHQLRHHPITWRQIGTFEATRLFLKDMCFAHDKELSPNIAVWKKIEGYQDVANRAVRKELGPLRSPSDR